MSPHGSSSPPLSPSKRSNLGPPPAVAAAGVASRPPGSAAPAATAAPSDWQQLCASAQRPPSNSLTLREQYQLQQAQQHQQYPLRATAADGSPGPPPEQPGIAGAAEPSLGGIEPAGEPSPPLQPLLQAGEAGAAAAAGRPGLRGASMPGAGREHSVSWVHQPARHSELLGWPASPGRAARRSTMAFGYLARDPSAAAELAAAGAAAAAAMREQLSAAEQQRRAALAEAEARQAEETLAEMRGSFWRRQQQDSEGEGLLKVPEEAEGEAAAAAGGEGGVEKGGGPSRSGTDDSEEVWHGHGGMGAWAQAVGLGMHVRALVCRWLAAACLQLALAPPHPLLPPLSAPAHCRSSALPPLSYPFPPFHSWPWTTWVTWKAAVPPSRGTGAGASGPLRSPLPPPSPFSLLGLSHWWSVPTRWVGGLRHGLPA